jgi:hypothetical protein
MLRLREVMTRARTLDEGMAVWNTTQNTVGFNHGMGSAVDKSALLLETMMHKTSVFGADDPREAVYMYDVDGDGTQENIGRPRKEAIFRTNHGYDPYSIAHFQWNGTGAMRYSVERYMLFADMFDAYQAQGVRIGVPQAVNITAMVGDKGEDDMSRCRPPYDEAANVLSITYDPSALHMYIAWENGRRSDGSWSPAACNTYVKLDMTEFFGA